MAEIEILGMSSLIKDLESLCASDSCSRLVGDATDSMARVAQKALIQSAKTRMRIRSEKLAGSVKISKGIGKRKGYAVVGPTGTHHTYRAIGGGDGVARAGHVGYVLEYGAPDQGIRGRQWVSKAVVQCEDEAIDEAQRVYDEFMKEFY